MKAVKWFSGHRKVTNDTLLEIGTILDRQSMNKNTLFTEKIAFLYVFNLHNGLSSWRPIMIFIVNMKGHLALYSSQKGLLVDICSCTTTATKPLVLSHKTWHLIYLVTGLEMKSICWHSHTESLCYVITRRTFILAF